MARLRVYDIKANVLAVDLKDLLRLLAPRSLQANWMVSAVQSSRPGHEWFEATGEGGEQLELMAQSKAHLSGAELAALAGSTRQVIWGEFAGFAPAEPDKAWLVIRAVDSAFYEIETDDEAVLSNIRSAYRDIRTGEVPVAEWVVGGSIDDG